MDLPLFPLKIVKAKASYKVKQIPENKKEFVRIDKAIGRVCAETIVSYPPGIPLVGEGEVFYPELVDYLKKLSKTGTFIIAKDASLRKVKVLGRE